jgi:hypothetical protein
MSSAAVHHTAALTVATAAAHPAMPQTGDRPSSLPRRRAAAGTMISGGHSARAVAAASQVCAALVPPLIVGARYIAPGHTCRHPFVDHPPAFHRPRTPQRNQRFPPPSCPSPFVSFVDQSSRRAASHTAPQRHNEARAEQPQCRHGQSGARQHRRHPRAATARMASAYGSMVGMEIESMLIRAQLFSGYQSAPARCKRALGQGWSAFGDLFTLAPARAGCSAGRARPCCGAVPWPRRCFVSGVCRGCRFSPRCCPFRSCCRCWPVCLRSLWSARVAPSWPSGSGAGVLRRWSGGAGAGSGLGCRVGRSLAGVVGPLVGVAAVAASSLSVRFVALHLPRAAHLSSGGVGAAAGSGSGRTSVRPLVAGVVRCAGVGLRLGSGLFVAHRSDETWVAPLCPLPYNVIAHPTSTRRGAGGAASMEAQVPRKRSSNGAGQHSCTPRAATARLASAYGSMVGMEIESMLIRAQLFSGYQPAPARCKRAMGHWWSAFGDLFTLAPARAGCSAGRARPCCGAVPWPRRRFVSGVCRGHRCSVHRSVRVGRLVGFPCRRPIADSR